VKFAFIQVSGGVGAQIVSCLAIKSLLDKGYLVFRDGRYFGKRGSATIPDGITYFDKVLSDSLLNFSVFEKNIFICRLVKLVFLCGLKFFPNSIVFYEGVASNRKSSLNEAADYASTNKSSDIVRTIKSELFGQRDFVLRSDIVAHVRRGDYLAAGLPTTPLQAIFRAAIKIAGKKSIGLLLVTDSPRLIELELHNEPLLDIDLVIQSSELLEDLYSLINSETFIASYSQFSLIAIWLSDTMRNVACPMRFKHEGLINTSNYETIEWY
jgi:hypothetical protein